MSLYPQDPTTAVLAADTFRKLMLERPQFWAENVAEATSCLKDSGEQIDFLRWMADPKGVVREQNANTKAVPVKQCKGMEDHPDYELTGVIPGKIPTYQVTYRPRSQDDEKTEL